MTGSSTEEHLTTLEKVLQVLEGANLRLNKSKCLFFQKSVEYLGHRIDEQGLHPTDEKVIAIREAPKPRNVSELRAFLGIINYYSKFLPNLSAKLSPLYNLLRKKVRWTWGPQHDAAFQSAKVALQTDSLLVHFDPTKPIVLACDASNYGLGAVLSHVMDDGQERPIAYASRTLNPAEKNYSQLEKEGLAIIFGVSKFHNYLYGHQFEIESDHQPLSYLFSEKKRTPQFASSRIQRWALTLSGYQYTIRYKAGRSLSNADTLSRFPRPVFCTNDGVTGDLVLLLNHLTTIPTSAANIKEWTTKDPVLSKVRRYTLVGWPEEQLEADFKPYSCRRQELSVLNGCVLWGSRVIIPPQGRESVLRELHETHPGASKMKALARSYVWWPKMDAAIEDIVRQCDTCQMSRPSPAAAPLHPWEWPAQPWSRLHLDFAGPFLGHMFLVLVDAYSKWMDVRVMQSITATKTVEELRTIFATHGLPQKVVTDNGPTFTSSEFQDFMSKNGIKLIHSAPYHPSTNGLAERAVQSFKLGIKRIQSGSIQERLSKYLFKYRITPHSTTGVSPAELLMGRRPRSALDLLFPEVSSKVESQQCRQKKAHDSNALPARSFSVNDPIFARNFTGGSPNWLPGRVTKVTGPLSYEVELLSGGTVRRHVDAVRRREPAVSTTEPEQGSHDPFPDEFPSSPNPVPDPPAMPPIPQPLRRSTRVSHPPNWYM